MVCQKDDDSEAFLPIYCIRPGKVEGRTSKKHGRVRKRAVPPS